MGLYVETPDGLGEVLSSQSAHGRTSYLVKGAGFEGWYDGLQVTSDWADQPDDVIPNEDNNTVLPYPSEPQGPGWDGTNSTIQPNIDPDLDISGASDSLTGEPTSEDPVDADIEGLFEPSSHLAGVRPRRLHFATHDDPILNVATLPESSPTGLENSPLNPDNVDTDDLFDGSLPHFERESAAIYDRLVFQDEFSFMRYAADTDGDGDDDDKKKHHHENKAGYPVPKDNDDNDDDGDSDDGDSSDSDGGESSDGGGDSGGGDGGSGGHTASFALSTTADLHFLANFCNCASSLPLHSKSEHRELVIEASAEEVTPQPLDLEKLLERYEQNNFHWQESNLRNLVDRSQDDGDSADLYNKLAFVKHADGYDKYIGGSDGAYYLIASGGGKLPKGEHYGHYDSYEDAHNAVEAIIARNHAHASTKTAAPAADPNAQPTQIESQIEQLMQFWAVDNNGWWHWTGSQADLALLNQMQQQMMAVGMPGGPPGQMQTQGSVHTANPALLAVAPELLGAGEGAAAGEGGMASQFGNLMGAGGGMGGVPSPASAMSGVADAISQFNGGRDQGVAHHGVPFQSYSFVIEENTPPAWRDYLRVVASDKMVALAAWKDVVQKSKRLRSEGAISWEMFKPEVATAYVQGDHGKYYTTVQRLGSFEGAGRQLTTAQVSGWSCECEWGQWAWLRKRSFVGRMCSHAYALFSEAQSLDWKARLDKGKPIKISSVTNKASWVRNSEGFEWVSDDSWAPTAAITRTAAGWDAQVWSDGLAEDSLSLGLFSHSEKARRVAASVITAHVKTTAEGDVDVVGGTFKPYEAPDSIAGEGDYDPYSEDGAPEALVPEEREEGSAGVQEGNTRTGAALSGDDDEGPEETDDGIEEEEPDDDEDSLDEEIAEDEGDSDDEDEGDEPEESDDDDGGHDEPHRDEDDDEDEGTDNPGDESDDEGIEKQSSVAELQERYGLTHLAGAQYSLAQQAALVGEGEGKTARNHGDLNLTGTHYEAKEAASPEDTLVFLF